MTFKYLGAKILDSELHHLEKTPTMYKHVVTQGLEDPVYNMCKYYITHSILAITKASRQRILKLSIGYRYLIPNLLLAAPKQFSDIIADSIERFHFGYLKFVEGHYVSEMGFTYDLEYEPLIDEINKHLNLS